MEKQLFQNYSEEQRVSFLKDNCDAVEDIGYMRRFTPEELSEKKERLSSVAIDLNDIDQEKKEVMDEFKGRLKPLETEKVNLLRQLKNKTEFVKEPCFKFINEKEGMVGFYNSLGELISSRPLMAEERQRSIPFLRTATN